MRRVWRRWVETLDDRLNPIVVKELRQAVRGRFVAAVLLVFLLFELGTLTVFLLTTDTQDAAWLTGRGRGQDVFGFIIGVLFFVAIFTLPIYVAARLMVEQANESLSLVFVTTLPPRRIVAGKLVATQVLAMLLFSACLPFVSFTYFLRGIDLPSILVVFVFGFVVVTAAIQGAILLACLPTGRFLKIVLGIASLVGLFMVFTATVTASMALVVQGVGSRLGSWGFWSPAGTFLAIMAFLVALCFLLSTALVSPAVANRAPPVRRFLGWTWLASAVVATVASGYGTTDRMLEAWTLVWMLIAVGAAIVASGAPDVMSRRVARGVPRTAWRRWRAFFLWSGSAPGMAWSATVAGLTLGLAFAVDRISAADLADARTSAAGLAGYGFAYALAALLLHRRFLARRVPRRYTWMVALGLMAAGSLVPPLAGFLISPDAFANTSDALRWSILNPFASLFGNTGAAAAWFALAWAGVMAMVAMPWFLRRVRAFRPPPADSILSGTGDSLSAADEANRIDENRSSKRGGGDEPYRDQGEVEGTGG